MDEGDKFTWGEHGEELEILDDGKTISKKNFYGWQSAFSEQTFSSSTYKSDRILLRFSLSLSDHQQARIGFVNRNTQKKFFWRSRGSSATGWLCYAFDVENGRILSHDSHIDDWTAPFSKESKQRKACAASGDVIVLELNFYDADIKYYKNGILLGTLFKNIDTSDDTSYHAAAALVDSGDSVTLERCLVVRGDEDGLPLEALEPPEPLEPDQSQPAESMDHNELRSLQLAQVGQAKLQNVMSLSAPAPPEAYSATPTSRTDRSAMGQDYIQQVYSVSHGAQLGTQRMVQGLGQGHMRCFLKFINFMFDLFVCYWCVGRCCCRRCCSRPGAAGSSAKYKSLFFASDGVKCRSWLYTGVTFCYAWMYFIGAIALVPYAAQMALNTLATATAVAIFIKRRELSIKHFRILTGAFTPVVMFMSSYAAWNLRDTISQEALDSSPELEQWGLALFLALVDGVWVIVSTIYIIVLDEEIFRFRKLRMQKMHVVHAQDAGREEDQKSKKRRLVSLRWVGRLVVKFGPVSGRFGSGVYVVHIGLGGVYMLSCVAFLRDNDFFLLEVVNYVIALVLGAVVYMYVTHVQTRNLEALECCTQLLILAMGVSGTRVLYALLGGFDFGNIGALPTRIVAVTFLCWGFLLYRTLEVIEWNFESARESKE